MINETRNSILHSTQLLQPLLKTRSEFFVHQCTQAISPNCVVLCELTAAVSSLESHVPS